MTRLRWCARWAWTVLLIVGAAQPPPLYAQSCPPTLTIVPSSVGMPIGTSVQLWTVATDSGAVVYPPVAWMSANWDTAQVSAAGLVTAVAAGPAMIWASTQRGARASARIDVGPPASLFRAQAVSWPGLGTWTWPAVVTLRTALYALSFADSTGAVVAHGQVAVFK